MISVSTTGAHVVTKRVKGCRQRLRKKQRTANARAVIMVEKWIHENFDTQGKPVGGWEPLAELTKSARRKGKKTRKGNKVLQDTGQLRSRWKHFYNAKMGKVTSGVNYGEYHDSDKPRKSGLPRRQILPDNKHIAPKLKLIYGKHVETQIDRSGLKSK